MKDYPRGFDPDEAYVTFYALPDGTTVAHGGMSAPPAVPEGATELTEEQYDAAQAVWEEATQAHRAAMRLADEKRAAAKQAASLKHFRALVKIMPEDTARMVSAYDGPWPVAK